MKKKSLNNISNLIWSVLMISSIVCFFTCLIVTSNLDKLAMALLPIGYCVFTLLFRRNFGEMTTNFAKLMINALCFVRLVVLPLLYSFQSESQLFEGQNSVSSYFFPACLLMGYEYFVVQLAIFLFERVRVKRRVRVQWKKIEFNLDISKRLVWCLFIYIVVLSVFLPQYTSGFKTIFMLGEKDFNTAFIENNYNVGTIGRILRTLYSLCFQLFRILFPAYLLQLAYVRTKHSRLPGVILAFSCGLQFVFLTSTFAEAIVSCVVLILFYIRCYPNRARKVLSILGLGTIGVMLLFFIVRYYVKRGSGLYSTDDGFLSYAALIINAYFSGVDNVAAVFNIPTGLQWEAFWADMIGAIPFNSTLFGDRGEKLQTYYNLYNAAYGQIPPSVGAGYYYFGPLVAPVFTGFFVQTSLHYYEKAEQIGMSLRCVACYFCSVAFALGTAMYSPAITLQWYFSWGAIMLIITKYTGNVVYSNNIEVRV